MGEATGITPIDHLARKISTEPWSKLVAKNLNIVLELIHGISAKLYGSLAVYYYLHNCEECMRIIDMYRKGSIPDVNIVVSPEERDLFKERAIASGFKSVELLDGVFGDWAVVMGKDNYPFYLRAYFTKVLKLNHNVVIDFNTLNPVLKIEELFLTKLQIHKPSNKHLADLGLLALKINDMRYIANYVLQDWGFAVDAYENIKECKSLFLKLATQGSLSHNIVKIIIDKLLKLNKYITSHPDFPVFLQRANSNIKYWNDYVGTP